MLSHINLSLDISKKSSLSYRTNGNIHMINNRNVNIITDEEGNRIALIKDIRFRGKQNIDWRSVKAYHIMKSQNMDGIGMM